MRDATQYKEAFVSTWGDTLTGVDRLIKLLNTDKEYFYNSILKQGFDDLAFKKESGTNACIFNLRLSNDEISQLVENIDFVVYTKVE